MTAGMGTLEGVGPAWESLRGGRIDRLIQLGVRLGRRPRAGRYERDGGLLGMSTFGPAAACW